MGAPTGRARLGARRARGTIALLVAAALVGCVPMGAGGAPVASLTPDTASSQPASGGPAGSASPSSTPSTPSSAAASSAAPTVSPTPTADDPLPAGPVTALVVGTDSRTEGSFAGNSDAIVIVQLSADRQTLALISVSRDSWVTLPGIGQAKINASFARGGTDLLVATLDELFGGLRFDYVVQTNFDGFVGLVDAVGGVTVDNATPAWAYYTTGGEVAPDGQGIAYDWTADPVALVDGTSLFFVRQRYGLPYGDLDRAERTRATLIGLLERLDDLGDDPAALAGALLRITAEVRITGDLSLEDMVALTALHGQLERDDVLSLMAPIEGFTGRAGASVNIVDEARTAELGAALRAGDVQSYVDRYGTGYAP